MYMKLYYYYQIPSNKKDITKWHSALQVGCGKEVKRQWQPLSPLLSSTLLKPHLGKSHLSHQLAPWLWGHVLDKGHTHIMWQQISGSHRTVGRPFPQGPACEWKDMFNQPGKTMCRNQGQRLSEWVFLGCRSHLETAAWMCSCPWGVSLWALQLVWALNGPGCGVDACIS